MSIVHNTPNNVNANAVIYSLSDAVKTLAMTLMVSMAEANNEMAMDEPNTYNTRQDFEDVFQDINLQALDAIPDLIHDLEQSLRRELTTMKYTAKVTRMDYKEDGELDDVTVKLNFI